MSVPTLAGAGSNGGTSSAFSLSSAGSNGGTSSAFSLSHILPLISLLSPEDRARLVVELIRTQYLEPIVQPLPLSYKVAFWQCLSRELKMVPEPDYVVYNIDGLDFLCNDATMHSLLDKMGTDAGTVLYVARSDHPYFPVHPKDNGGLGVHPEAYAVAAALAMQGVPVTGIVVTDVAGANLSGVANAVRSLPYCCGALAPCEIELPSHLHWVQDDPVGVNVHYVFIDNLLRTVVELVYSTEVMEEDSE